MRSDQGRALLFGVLVHVTRFGVIVGALAAAGFAGVSGWYLGLVANVTCVIYAVVLVTWRRLWRASGLFIAWRGWVAALFLLPLIAEAVSWAVPAGLENRPPGYGLWAVSLLLVGLNEELISRVVVLERMRMAFTAPIAVTVTAALFGFQHLSALVTTSRTFEDVGLNVLVSACYGAALAAFQYRYRWIWPLILIHATADFTTILTPEPFPDPVIAFTLVVFVITALLLLRTRLRRPALDETNQRNDQPASGASPTSELR